MILVCGHIKGRHYRLLFSVCQPNCLPKLFTHPTFTLSALFCCCWCPASHLANMLLCCSQWVSAACKYCRKLQTQQSNKQNILWNWSHVEKLRKRNWMKWGNVQLSRWKKCWCAVALAYTHSSVDMKSFLMTEQKAQKGTKGRWWFLFTCFKAKGKNM